MDMPEWYKEVCGPKFKDIKDGQDEIQKSIAEIRERIFNGMGERIKLNTKLIILILAGVIFSIAAPIVLNLLS